MSVVAWERGFFSGRGLDMKETSESESPFYNMSVKIESRDNTFKTHVDVSFTSSVQ